MVTAGGSRKWQPSERAVVIDIHRKINTFGSDAYASTAILLQRRHPKMFGRGSPGKASGITRQDVKQIVLAENEGERANS